MPAFARAAVVPAPGLSGINKKKIISNTAPSNPDTTTASG